jgi:molybdopterin synthase sulfur carrier subunit
VDIDERAMFVPDQGLPYIPTLEIRYMATVTVRYFASIRERLGRSEDHIDAAQAKSVADVWRLVAGEPLPANTLVAVNQEYARPESAVRAGDEVAFFPPVTGG